jgi:hypothetical protein
LREFHRDRIANVGREGRDAALTRKMIPEKSDLPDVGGYFHGAGCIQLSGFSRTTITLLASTSFSHDRTDSRARRATHLNSRGYCVKTVQTISSDCGRHFADHVVNRIQDFESPALSPKPAKVG